MFVEHVLIHSLQRSGIAPTSPMSRSAGARFVLARYKHFAPEGAEGRLLNDSVSNERGRLFSQPLCKSCFSALTFYRSLRFLLSRQRSCFPFQSPSFRYLHRMRP